MLFQRNEEKRFIYKKKFIVRTSKPSGNMKIFWAEYPEKTPPTCCIAADEDLTSKLLIFIKNPFSGYRVYSRFVGSARVGRSVYPGTLSQELGRPALHSLRNRAHLAGVAATADEKLKISPMTQRVPCFLLLHFVHKT